MSKEDCHTCGEEFEDNCEFCSFAYPFCSLECYDKYDEGAAMDNKRISEIVEEEMIKQDVNRYRDMRKILTIPQSIADLLDKFIEFYFDDVGHEDWLIQENGLIEWFSKTPNCYIKDAYLAGKALGVDLVKVVEG